MTTPNELEYKLVTPENLGRFTEIVDVCFGLKVDEDYFKWKYFGNPVGGTVAFEARDGEKVAAFYGVIPEIYLINGEQVKIYQSMDTMTHPDYQRRGLFVKLANMTYDRVIQNEGRLELVGIPGSNSYHGLVNKLKWTNIHNFKYFFVNKLLFRAGQLLQSKSTAIIEQVSELTSELTDYLNQNRPAAKPIKPHLSPEFFAWRVFGHPYRGYKVAQIKVENTVVGICVYALAELKANRHNIFLLDFVDEGDFAKHTAAVIDFLFREADISFVHTWEPLKSVMRDAYRKCGFMKNDFGRGPFSYRVPLCVKSWNEKVNGVDWFDINNYDVQPLMQD